jgi:hypothetical protein
MLRRVTHIAKLITRTHFAADQILNPHDNNKHRMLKKSAAIINNLLKHGKHRLYKSQFKKKTLQYFSMAQ